MRAQRTSFISILACIAIISAADIARSQAPSSQAPPISIYQLELDKERVWTVFGRVMDLGGKPVGGAKVRIDVHVPGERPRIVLANLLGEFKTQYTLDSRRYTRLAVELDAGKEGYTDARETDEFGKDNKTREVILVLREAGKNSECLSLEALLSVLAPRFRSPSALASVPESARKDFQRGAEELWDQQDVAQAVAFLKKAVGWEPTCMNCRLLLALAQLKLGSWMSGDGQLGEAENLANSGKSRERSAELYLTLGVYETWRREEKKAVGYFLKALEGNPNDPLVLQELGRTLILQKDWESADRYLEKAVSAGASPEARLLRARALLEENDADAAEVEMKAYLGRRHPQDLPATARMIYLQLKERLELKAYGKVTSVLSQTVEDLKKAMPELQALEPAATQEELPGVLAKVGENVSLFFHNFPDTVSVEEIQSENLRRDGTPGGSTTEKFNYLLLAHSETWGLGLSEYRTNPVGSDVKPAAFQGGSIRTAGFASSSLVFHPLYQAGSSFRFLGRQLYDGRRTYAIAFAQQPEKSQMIGRFDEGGVSAPVLFQGIAWVDPDSFQIIRLRTDLLKPLPRVRLVRETTEIQYAEVHFKEIPSAIWLPREVTVLVQWKGRLFRNSHRYSEFKLFNVEAKEKKKASVAPAKDAPPN